MHRSDSLEAPCPCPLCRTTIIYPHARAYGRKYFACSECGLIFMARGARPTPSDEKARYVTHKNDPADADYRAFLSRLADPLVDVLPSGASGLDYGSGPGPALSVMLEERGHPTAIYDPFFAPDERALGRSYDFITCSETVEHFFRPNDEFELLYELLRPGGWLGLMTRFVPDGDFETWWYVRDETHVCFYRTETMQWIADQFDWTLHLPAADVALFQRAGN